jgi:hypothetical protein
MRRDGLGQPLGADSGYGLFQGQDWRAALAEGGVGEMYQAKRQGGIALRYRLHPFRKSPLPGIQCNDLGHGTRQDRKLIQPVLKLLQDPVPFLLPQVVQSVLLTAGTLRARRSDAPAPPAGFRSRVRPSGFPPGYDTQRSKATNSVAVFRFPEDFDIDAVPAGARFHCKTDHSGPEEHLEQDQELLPVPGRSVTEPGFSASSPRSDHPSFCRYL